jgi:hypothetical protein
MGKKRSRDSVTSKGERTSVNRKLRNAARSEYLASRDRVYNQALAYKKGKNVVLTVPNPDKNNTKERMIRVNARDYWRSSKDAT